MKKNTVITPMLLTAMFAMTMTGCGSTASSSDYNTADTSVSADANHASDEAAESEQSK